MITGGQVDSIPSMKTLLQRLREFPEPDCGQSFTTEVSCDSVPPILYTGSIKLDIKPGDVLAINGFKVMVTEGGPNGKGLLYYKAFGDRLG